MADRNRLVDPFGTFSGSNLPTTPTLRDRPGESFLIGGDLAGHAHVVNEFRINASWASQHIPPYGDTWERATYGFQFPPTCIRATAPGTTATAFPMSRFPVFANFKGPAFALHSPSTDTQVADTAFPGSTAGTSVKAGCASFATAWIRTDAPPSTGNVTFKTSGNTNTTGNAVADMLLGNFRNFNEASADPMGFFRFSQPGAFVQDSWKATRRLSLEFGLRWENMGPMYTQANNMVNFVPALFVPGKSVQINSAGTLVPGVGNPYNGLVIAGAACPRINRAACRAARRPSSNRSPPAPRVGSSTTRMCSCRALASLTR